MTNHSAFSTFNLQISAQFFNKDVCDKQIMNDMHRGSCNCNNFTGFYAIMEDCRAHCKGTDPKKDCCSVKCFFQNHLMFNDGKVVNKTAVSSVFGPADDSKIVENIDVCESIGKIINMAV